MKRARFLMRSAAAFAALGMTLGSRLAFATLALSNETTWMGRQILPWITQHRDTPDAPATLRELVYASRYRMKDTPTSRQAFQLLHKLYPKSDEARDTKYYY